MRDENQAPTPHEGPAPPPGEWPVGAPAPPAPHAAFVYLEPGPGTAAPPAPPEPLPRAALVGALALALLGLLALALGQVEAALLVAVGALYFTAQGADVHPAMGRVYALLAWIPPVTGAVALGALAGVLLTTGPLTPERVAVAVASGLGAPASLVLLWRPAADRLARALFRGTGPSHTLRLSAGVVLMVLWVALPAWLAFRDQLAELLRDPAALVGAEKLSGGLVGYVVLAFAAVGLAVRRDLRGALARLGLVAPRPVDGLTVAVGILALWLFNAGTEQLERNLFPALWASDQAFTAALAGFMGPGLMVLLSLSAGIGEEVTLRGALQPKLGILLTSLLFAALHVQYSWFGMLSILAFGLLLGLIRRHANTTAAILVHSLYNLLAVATAKP